MENFRKLLIYCDLIENSYFHFNFIFYFHFKLYKTENHHHRPHPHPHPPPLHFHFHFHFHLHLHFIIILKNNYLHFLYLNYFNNLDIADFNFYVLFIHFYYLEDNFIIIH
jgi:hypothetical protein